MKLCRPLCRGSFAALQRKEQNTWLVEGVGIGMLAGYWLGRALGNAVLGLALGVLAGMFLGSKIKKK